MFYQAPGASPKYRRFGVTTHDFNSILSQLGAGERASAKLMGALYGELHAMANRMMRRERGSHTLQPTALVHEAFLRLVDAEKAGAQGHLHFLDAAAVTMRRVLVDYARAASAEKRGGADKGERVTVRALVDDQGGGAVDIAALDEALSELAAFDERHARIVELRFFGGMSGDQIAEHLEISRSTVGRDLAFARAWLQRRLRQ